LVKIINPEDDKRLNPISALRYIELNRFKVERFLDERVRKEDRYFVLKEMLKNPVALAYIIKNNYEYDERRRIKIVVDKITREGTITVMLGAKRHGKSSTSVWLLEYIHKHYPDKKLYWIGYSEAIEKYYPYVNQTINLVEPDENSFVVFDEASLFLFSRDAMSKQSKEKIKELPTLGHRGASVLFISQSAQMVDIDIFLLCDFIWFKPFFAVDFDERLNIPTYLKYILPKNKNENLVYDMHEQFFYVFKNPLPSIWNDELSKPYSKIKTKEKAQEFLGGLLKMGFDEKTIDTILKIRGWSLEQLLEEDSLRHKKKR